MSGPFSKSNSLESIRRKTNGNMTEEAANKWLQ